MEMKILDPNFLDVGKHFLWFYLAFIAILVCFARTTKPYGFDHLLIGILLIGIGMGTLKLALSLDLLMETMADARAMTKTGEQDARQMWAYLRLSIPILAFSFGTRFVGNWVSTERPARKRDALLDD